MEDQRITRTMLTGYPNGHPKQVPRSKRLVDVYNDEIEEGEEYFIIDCEIVSWQSIEKYLIEQVGAEKKVHG